MYPDRGVFHRDCFPPVKLITHPLVFLCSDLYDVVQGANFYIIFWGHSSRTSDGHNIMKRPCSIIVLIDKLPNCTTAGPLSPTALQHSVVVIAAKASVYRGKWLCRARAKRKRAAALRFYSLNMFLGSPRHWMANCPLLPLSVLRKLQQRDMYEATYLRQVIINQLGFK